MKASLALSSPILLLLVSLQPLDETATAPRDTHFSTGVKAMAALICDFLETQAPEP